MQFYGLITIYEDKPIQIINTKEQVLRTSVYHLVKVLWGNRNQQEKATLELRGRFQRKYPHLLLEVSKTRLEDRIF